jgi:ferritin-like metal-binding protein YciE
MKESALRELYLDELKDLYSAENQLVEALPKMAEAATSADLKAGFKEHLKQTEEHVRRLEKIFKALDDTPEGKKCKGMAGLIKEGSEMIDEDPGKEELDAGLIAAAQRVEHYEIAGYGCVATYAKILGERDAVAILRMTLDEEKTTDKKLTSLAENINIRAADAKNQQSGKKSRTTSA